MKPYRIFAKIHLKNGTEDQLFFKSTGKLMPEKPGLKFLLNLILIDRKQFHKILLGVIEY